jgi:hypothetical protein
MNTEIQTNQWDKIVAEASKDDNFKKRLLANPAAVLKERGVEVPAGVQIRVLEDTDQVIHLTLPAQAQEEELSDEALEGVAGGAKIGAVIRKVGSQMTNTATPGQGAATGGGLSPSQQGASPSQGAGRPA